ncbi:MAG: N-acetylmuramoyl-L-alanine amidase [Syntrophothermus sp.]
MQIIKKFISFNYTPNQNIPKFIVIHDTGNKQPGANAEMHYKYFNSGNKNASAHFFVDDKQILQLVAIQDKAWHVGDGKGKYGIKNSNSIGIEICVNKDGNYDLAVKNTIELVIYLMHVYNIQFNYVVRHYDASRKNCPASMNKDSEWTGWIKFKEELKQSLNKYIKLQGVTNNMFNDIDKVSEYAKPSVERLEALKIFVGDEHNNFNPDSNITRQDFAVVVDRMLKLLGK